jgi:hypothetical protein
MKQSNQNHVRSLGQSLSFGNNDSLSSFQLLSKDDVDFNTNFNASEIEVHADQI